MSRLKSIVAPLGIAVALIASSSASASSIKAVLHACAAGRVTLGLHVSHAEEVPTAGSLTGSAHAIVGRVLAEARNGGKGACPSDASASILRQANHLLWLYRHRSRSQARKALARLLAAIRSEAHQASNQPVAHAAAGCTFDGARHISLHDAAGVADFLAVARDAMLVGDEQGAEEALDAARSAYSEWAAHWSGAQSAGDWLAVAAGAQLLGLDGVERTALGHARSAAKEGLEQAEKLDPCSVTRQDAPCVVKALSIAMLLGIDSPSDLATVTKLLEAATEQAAGKTPNGCEQWSLTVKITGPNGGVLSWGPGLFRVNRKTATIADAPGVGAGWPGEVGAESGPCTEEGVVVGTGSFPAVPFHFNISGSVAGTGFSLQLASGDSKVSITVTGPPACQALGALAEVFVNAFLGAPFPIELPVAEGQRSATLEFPTGEGSINVSAQRTN